MTRHVILVTYGEPPDPAFLDQLLYSWRILLGLTLTVAPIPKYVLPMIAVKRAFARNRMWTAEEYRSPLEVITRNQADDMAEALRKMAPDQAWKVHAAYEFRDPLLSELLRKLPATDPVTIVPMYVADSAFTHEISKRTAQLASRNGRAAPIRVLGALDERILAEILSQHVIAEIERRGAGGQSWALLLAAHGTLLQPPRPMETGRAATERIALAMEERLRSRFGTVGIGWLNHVYGGKWTEPSVEEAIVELWDEGYKQIVYFPFGFLADNAETELEGRIALRTRPWIEMYHLPCVNDSDALAVALARQLRSATP